MANLRLFSAEEILAVIGIPTIGGVGLHDIKVDIQSSGVLSKRTIAKNNFEAWASDIDLDINALDTTKFSNLEAALKWYTLFLYKEWDIIRKTKEECGDEDFRQKQNYRTQANLHLKQIGDSASGMIGKLADSINAETSVGPLAYDLTGLIQSTIVTDDHCSARRNEPYVGDMTIEIKDDENA